MIKTVSVQLCAFLLCLLPGVAMADAYVGTFSGDLDGRRYEVEIEQVNESTYEGILRIDGDRMQLDARRYGDQLRGRLNSEAGALGFNARIQGSILVLQTQDNRRVVLWRDNPE